MASDGSTSSAERLRLQEAEHGLVPWKRWGPYLAERAWGTVREDYSPYGTAWEFFPHDHARSRAYRWNEDGLAGWCDDRQTLCLALVFWNGRDPILKERIFGLTGNEGNHSEDAKEYWWFVDSTPTHSYMRWRYHYPQAEFPYADLVAENGRRTKLDPEYELLDTGVFAEDRYWAIEAEFAKATPDDVYVRVTLTNAGPEPATIDVLPTLWFRNTWAWGIDPRRPSISTEAGYVIAEHHELGRYILELEGDPELLFCDNETNAQRLFGIPSSPYPKDGVNDHVVHGAATVNPDRVGTKMAARYRLAVEAGGSAEVCFELGPASSREEETFDEVMAARQRRGRRLLRAHHAGHSDRGRSAGASAGLRGVALVEAVLPLRRRALARRGRVDVAATSRAVERAQQGLAPPRQPRRALDARHMGVPVVRGVGPRLPLRRARARRCRLRKATAASPAARVVPTPEWSAARV